MSATLAWPCAAVPEADLAPRTTIRVGGRAEWLLEPATPGELVAAWCAARERGYEPRLLGGGANLLVPDGLLPGVVIATERLARVFRPHPEGGAREGDEFTPVLPAQTPLARDVDARLVAWAGATLPGLVRITRDLGWSGFEGLAGVPGHLGGGVAMNAGGRWGETWGVVESVRLLGRDGLVQDRRRAECAPRYRDGNLEGAIVLGAVLAFRVDERAAVRERVAGFLREKSAAQPVTEHSCGCVFKNPDRERSGGRSAGQLIEAAGAKGLARGDALVSPKHGNFVVNRGRASASDVLALIHEVRARVAERFGLELELEVKLWG
ncbi:MAG TPA: FAD-binding protein [Planctomycetota bacterium]